MNKPFQVLVAYSSRWVGRMRSSHPRGRIRLTFYYDNDGITLMRSFEREGCLCRDCFRTVPALKALDHIIPRTYAGHGAGTRGDVVWINVTDAQTVDKLWTVWSKLAKDRRSAVFHTV